MKLTFLYPRCLHLPPGPCLHNIKLINKHVAGRFRNLISMLMGEREVTVFFNPIRVLYNMSNQICISLHEIQTLQTCTTKSVSEKRIYRYISAILAKE